MLSSAVRAARLFLPRGAHVLSLLKGRPRVGGGGERGAAPVHGDAKAAAAAASLGGDGGWGAGSALTGGSIVEGVSERLMDAVSVHAAIAAGRMKPVQVFRKRWYHRRRLTPRRLPLVLLVDRKTASAAEVFAAALAHEGGATVVGEATYGKGLSQALVQLEEGRAVCFTCYALAAGRYFPPTPPYAP